MDETNDRLHLSVERLDKTGLLLPQYGSATDEANEKSSSESDIKHNPDETDKQASKAVEIEYRTTVYDNSVAVELEEIYDSGEFEKKC